MATTPNRLQVRHADLWRWPLVAAVAALVAGLVLPYVPVPSSAADVLWPGDRESASTALQALSTGALTTLALVFSVTVVALQLASQQFSPRLLRDFLRDGVTKAVLAVLVATFVYTLAVTRSLHEDRPVPALAMGVAMLVGLAALTSVVLVISHITRRLRVDTMMVSVHAEARDAIAQFYPDRDDPRPLPPPDGLAPDPLVVPAPTSGFVRSVDVGALVDAAARHGLLVLVEARPGDHVVRQTPMLSVWDGQGRRPTSGRLPDGGADELLAAVSTGYERTIEQDAAFGFRQLADIAGKALSPGINDPVTAVHAVGHMSDLLVLLTGRRLGPTLHLDADGTGRAVVQDRDLRYYLDLACGQVRRYGRREPTVLVALLRMLRDVAAAARPADHQEIRRQVELVLEEAAPEMVASDRRAVEDMAGRVLQAVAGDVLGAYRDRSGETRSV